MCDGDPIISALCRRSMNQYTQLLSQGAKEMREYCRAKELAGSADKKWLDGLANRMEAASRLEDRVEVEKAIGAIAHSMTDSGPFASEAVPSFGAVLDALQRKRKREK
jgi:hypothetical protein